MGGKSATGGAALGGATTGGRSATGGAALGGAPMGGKSATGGAAAGGVATGGAATTGGAGTGGVSTASTATSDPCTAGAPLTGGTQHCNENNSGSYGSYTWQLWSNTTTGCLTTYTNGAFSANWNSSGDLLARVGLRFDDTKTYQELGTFSADFAETRTGTAAAYSYIGAYGWSVEPTVEFYIIEDSFNTLPLNPGGILLGTVATDAGIYDVYKGQVTGTTIIYQFFSVRRTSRHCGHISISDHFSKWTNLGMQLGKLHEVNILVEAGGGTGSIDFTTVSVVVN
jgi:endo-1,4-beta-xylanase